MVFDDDVEKAIENVKKPAFGEYNLTSGTDSTNLRRMSVSCQ